MPEHEPDDDDKWNVLLNEEFIRSAAVKEADEQARAKAAKAITEAAAKAAAKAAEPAREWPRNAAVAVVTVVVTGLLAHVTGMFPPPWLK